MSRFEHAIFDWQGLIVPEFKQDKARNAERSQTHLCSHTSAVGEIQYALPTLPVGLSRQPDARTHENDLHWVGFLLPL